MARKIKQNTKVLKVGIVAAVLGAIVQLSDVAKGFPYPLDFIGNIIVFCAVLIIVADLARRRYG